MDVKARAENICTNINKIIFPTRKNATKPDHLALVDAASQVDHYLPRAMVVHNFELANVAVFHHYSQKTDDHF